MLNLKKNLLSIAVICLILPVEAAYNFNIRFNNQRIKVEIVQNMLTCLHRIFNYCSWSSSMQPISQNLKLLESSGIPQFHDWSLPIVIISCILINLRFRIICIICNINIEYTDSYKYHDSLKRPYIFYQFQEQGKAIFLGRKTRSFNCKF